MRKNGASSHKQATKEAADLPVYPALANRMTVDFLFNEKGEVWLLHNRPLPAKLQWVEYDADLASVTLVTEAGKVQDIGINMPVDFAHHVLEALELTALQVEGKKIIDFAQVPLIARDTRVN